MYRKLHTNHYHHHCHIQVINMNSYYTEDSRAHITSVEPYLLSIKLLMEVNGDQEVKGPMIPYLLT